MAIQGLRDTSNFVANARPQNWREGIMLLAPNGDAPLTALTSLMKKRNVDDFTYNWWEKMQQTRRVAITTTLNATDTVTSLKATGGGCKAFVAGDLLMAEHTSEIVQVLADPTADTEISVARGQLGTTKTALTIGGAGVNPYFICVGNAFEEGSLPPTGIAFDPTQRYNYTQIFRKTFEATRTATKTRLRTADAVKEAKRECLELMTMDMERAFWWGKRYSGTKNGRPFHTTGGIESFIDSGNIKTATAAGVDYDEFESYLMEMFKYGSKDKMGFTGNRGMNTINQMVRKNTALQIQSGIKEFGMDVVKLTCHYGTLTLKTHPLFNVMASGTTGSASYAGKDASLYVLDMKEISYVAIDDVTYQPKLETNGLDGLQSGYLAECGLEVHHPLSHYLVKGLLAGKKDD